MKFSRKGGGERERPTHMNEEKKVREEGRGIKKSNLISLYLLKLTTVLKIFLIISIFQVKNLNFEIIFSYFS